MQDGGSTTGALGRPLAACPRGRRLDTFLGFALLGSTSWVPPAIGTLSSHSRLSKHSAMLKNHTSRNHNATKRGMNNCQHKTRWLST